MCTSVCVCLRMAACVRCVRRAQHLRSTGKLPWLHRSTCAVHTHTHTHGGCAPTGAYCVLISACYLCQSCRYYSQSMYQSNLTSPSLYYSAEPRPADRRARHGMKEPHYADDYVSTMHDGMKHSPHRRGGSVNSRPDVVNYVPVFCSTGVSFDGGLS